MTSTRPRAATPAAAAMPLRSVALAAALLVAATMLAPGAAHAAHAAQPRSPGDETLPGDPPDGWWEAPDHPTGFYFRATGGWFDPQSDALRRDGSGPVGTDDGFGGSLAVGWRDLTQPIAFEFEYGYRQVETDVFIDPDTMLLADNELDLHTLSLNLMLDAPNLIGPVGLYAGGGIGARLGQVRVRSIDIEEPEEPTTTISGEGFLWQLMAGVTVEVAPNAQLHAGVRWSDGGTIDEGPLRYDTEALAIEVGFRLYF